jgi:surfactin synthase thioesterase subunit/3-oxoacyl-(acyl-carrier-protein) synthase/acyl carrier protein
MNNTTTLKNSLLMIQKLKKLLQEQKKKAFEPVAIIGMSCRVPQANNLDEFEKLMYGGKNIITPIPKNRLDLLQGTEEQKKLDSSLNYWGGYLDAIDEFDAYFFGISPREALYMDPQQRIVLEVAYEALEDAGFCMDALAGSNMGVFSSLYASQFSHLQNPDSAMDALFIPTGSAISMAANRLSYLFDLHGPSMVLDTACSSSLVAVHLACLNLQAQLCDTALISAVNINLLPSIHTVLAKATMLSPTGQCHTFDAKANGYVQGEGAGAIILKPLSQALKDKNKIYALILGSAVNQDGKTNGLTAPNGLQQEKLLNMAYEQARIDPSYVSYIECHGTGTFLGDPIEVQALGNVIGTKRQPNQPCWISSIKTNIGHLEPAAGIMGLIKTALVLKKRLIPQHLNLTIANPHIPFDKYCLKIPKKTEELPRYRDTAVAGVSSFGFGGSNAHIILGEYLEEGLEFPESIDKNQELFTLSAKNTSALTDLIRLWCTYLKNNPEPTLAQICYNLHVKRTHYPYRYALIVSSRDELALKLAQDQNSFKSLEPNKSFNPVLIEQFDNMELSSLAEHYLNHAQINWQKYEEERFYPPIDLPLYPWQRKKYWPDFESVSEDVNRQHPLRAKRIDSPLSEHQIEFIMDTKEVPEFKDTFYVVHAGYYFEMLAYAVKQVHQITSFSLRDFCYLLPLFASNEKSVRVHLTLEKKDSDWVFNFYSYEDKGSWVNHAKGILSLEKVSHLHLELKNEIIDRSLKEGTSKSFSQHIQSMKMPSEHTILWAEHYWHGECELFCELRKPKKSERIEQFVMNMHPGIIDACIQTVFLLLPENLRKPYLASNMGAVLFYGLSGEPKYIYTVLKKIDSDGKKISADWYLLDNKYSLIIACHNLCLTQVNEQLQINKFLEPRQTFVMDLLLPYQENKNRLVNFLSEQIAAIFSMPKNDINTQISLHELGMDSLMAAALTQTIEKTLGLSYSLTSMMKGPSIEELSKQILGSNFKQQSTESAWICNRKIQKKAGLRLFCFPYGGGGASIYREWQQEFPDTIELCPIQLPGRENRLDERPINHINQVVSEVAQHITPLLDLPFAFFGHSFGSLIAFELARYLRKNSLPQPVHLFVSAYPDPKKPSKSLDNLLARLSQMGIHLFDLNQEKINHLDAELLNTLSHIFKEHGIVDYSSERMDKHIIRVLLPIFIADMNIVKSYVYYEEPPLKAGITVFVGKQDIWVSPQDQQDWKAHTLKPCIVHEFDKGHLFIRDEEIRSQIIHRITQELSKYVEEGIEHCH